jgi:hypothetical protein
MTTQPWYENEAENSRRLNLLKAAIQHNLRGFVLEENPDLFGFVIRDIEPNWRSKYDVTYREPLYSAYVGEHGYSSYRCWINHHGVMDEQLLIEKAPVDVAVEAIYSQDSKDRPQHYRTIKRLAAALWRTLGKEHTV